jgi:hypothetical protein
MGILVAGNLESLPSGLPRAWARHALGPKSGGYLAHSHEMLAICIFEKAT